MAQRIVLMNDGGDPLHVVTVQRGPDGRFMHDKAEEPTVLVPSCALALAVDPSMRVVVSAGDRGERRRMSRRESDPAAAPMQAPAPAVQPLNSDEEKRLEVLRERHDGPVGMSDEERAEMDELEDRQTAPPPVTSEKPERPVDLGGPRKLMLLNPGGAYLFVHKVARGPDGRFERDNLPPEGAWDTQILEIEIPEGGEVLIDEFAPVATPQPMSVPA